MSAARTKHRAWRAHWRIACFPVQVSLNDVAPSLDSKEDPTARVASDPYAATLAAALGAAAAPEPGRDDDQHFGLLAALLRVKDTKNVRACRAMPCHRACAVLCGSRAGAVKCVRCTANVGAVRNAQHSGRTIAAAVAARAVRYYSTGKESPYGMLYCVRMAPKRMPK